MSERNYYVLCDDNCRFESMTKEQILAAITQAVEGHEIGDVDTGFVTTLKEQNKNTGLKFWVGTQAQYNALETKEPNCFYIITDEEDLIPQMAESINELEQTVAILEAKSEMQGVQLHSGAIPYGSVSVNVPNIDKYKIIAVITLSGCVGLCYASPAGIGMKKFIGVINTDNNDINDRSYAHINIAVSESTIVANTSTFFYVMSDGEEEEKTVSEEQITTIVGIL